MAGRAVLGTGSQQTTQDVSPTPLARLQLKGLESPGVRGAGFEGVRSVRSGGCPYREFDAALWPADVAGLVCLGGDSMDGCAAVLTGRRACLRWRSACGT